MFVKNKGVDCFETWRIYRIIQRGKGKIFGEATRKAIAETHAAGRPSCHGDNLGFIIFTLMALKIY